MQSQQASNLRLWFPLDPRGHAHKEKIEKEPCSVDVAVFLESVLICPHFLLILMKIVNTFIASTWHFSLGRMIVLPKQGNEGKKGEFRERR